MKEIQFAEFKQELEKAAISKLRSVLIEYYNLDKLFLKKFNKKELVSKIINQLNINYDYDNTQDIFNSILEILKDEKRR